MVAGRGLNYRRRQPKVLRVTGTSGRDTAELQILLRQRLRLIAAFAALASGIGATQKLLSFDLSAYTSILDFARAVWNWPDLAMGCLNLVAFGILACVLWRKTLPSLRVLRLYELIIFGLGLASFCENNWYVLNNHGWLAEFLRLQHLNILATWQSLPWFMIIVGYGTLIPNTGRRCAGRQLFRPGRPGPGRGFAGCQLGVGNRNLALPAAHGHVDDAGCCHGHCWVASAGDAAPGGVGGAAAGAVPAQGTPGGRRHGRSLSGRARPLAPALRGQTHSPREGRRPSSFAASNARCKPRPPCRTPTPCRFSTMATPRTALSTMRWSTYPA